MSVESPTLTSTAGKSLLVAIRSGVTLVDEPGGNLTLASPMGALTFKRLSAALRQAFNTLAEGSSTVDRLCDDVASTGGPEALTWFYHHFEQLLRRGLIEHTLATAGERIATILGIGTKYRFVLQNIEQGHAYVLSRFAYSRREGGLLVLECPLGHAQIILHDWRATALLSMMATRQRVSELAGRLPGIDDEAVEGWLQILLNANALAVSPEGSSDSEEGDPTLSQWNFHDLLFHSRSRFGRHNNPYGATFRHINRIKPLPAVKPPSGTARIDLYRPQMDKLEESDPPLARVMESRQSVYDYGKRPITLEQLGEFLFRVARVRSLNDMRVESSYEKAEEIMEVSSRPYPAGGKCYELEFYLAVDTCEGLPSGLYHYDPLDHSLTRVRDRDQQFESLMRYARVAAPRGHPQVLITLAARFQRVSWKYDGIAYATILKHVGVVYQSMYLVATAMGLGPCGLGSGDSDLFAAVAGTDYLAETSVGEFMLGSLPASEA